MEEILFSKCLYLLLILHILTYNTSHILDNCSTFSLPILVYAIVRFLFPITIPFNLFMFIYIPWNYILVHLHLVKWCLVFGNKNCIICKTNAFDFSSLVRNSFFAFKESLHNLF